MENWKELLDKTFKKCGDVLTEKDKGEIKVGMLYKVLAITFFVEITP